MKTFYRAGKGQNKLDCCWEKNEQIARSSSRSNKETTTTTATETRAPPRPKRRRHAADANTTHDKQRTKRQHGREKKRKKARWQRPFRPLSSLSSDLGHAGDGPVQLGLPRHLRHLLRPGVQVSVGDVVADRVVEEHRVLRHHPHRTTKARLRHLLDVLTGDLDAAPDLISLRS